MRARKREDDASARRNKVEKSVITPSKRIIRHTTIRNFGFVTVSLFLGLSFAGRTYAQFDGRTSHEQSARGAVQGRPTRPGGEESRAWHEDAQPISEERRARDLEWSRKAVAEIEASRSETVAYAVAIRTRDAATIRKIYRKHGIPAELEGATIIFDDHSGFRGRPSELPIKITVSVTITFHPTTIKADLGGGAD